MKKLVFFICVLILVKITAAQNNASQKDTESPWTVLRKNNSSGTYLKAFNYLISNRNKYLDSSVNVFKKADYFDVMVQLYNYFGEYKKALEAEDNFLEKINIINTIRPGKVKELAGSPVDSLQMLPVVEAIASIADKKQILIINEEHRTSAHRELTMELLPVLYKKGFRYLALETLTDNDSLLQQRKYPEIGTGYYTHDPVFGELVRQALKTGFKLIGYDYASSKIKLDNTPGANPFARENTRDSFGARLIIDKILKHDPHAQILIHVGRGHAAKIYDSGLAMLAWHLKEFTGIDPFTIDQVAMTEFANPLDESPLYRYVTSKYHFDHPVVFKKKNNSFWVTKQGYDMTVFSPRTRYVDGRPHWLLRSGQRKSIPIEYKKMGIRLKNGIYNSAPLIIQVVHKYENELTIPAQQVLLLPGEKSKEWFLLLKGEYTVQLKDENNLVLKQYSLNVK